MRFLINISQSSEIPGLKKCVFDFMRTYQTFLQSACTSVHPSTTSVLVIPMLTALVLSVFQKAAICQPCLPEDLSVCTLQKQLTTCPSHWVLSQPLVSLSSLCFRSLFPDIQDVGLTQEFSRIPKPKSHEHTVPSSPGWNIGSCKLRNSLNDVQP